MIKPILVGGLEHEVADGVFRGSKLQPTGLMKHEGKSDERIRAFSQLSPPKTPPASLRNLFDRILRSIIQGTAVVVDMVKSYAVHMSRPRNRDPRSVETFTIQMRPSAGGQVPKSIMHLDQEPELLHR